MTNYIKNLQEFFLKKKAKQLLNKAKKKIVKIANIKNKSIRKALKNTRKFEFSYEVEITEMDWKIQNKSVLLNLFNRPDSFPDALLYLDKNYKKLVNEIKMKTKHDVSKYKLFYIMLYSDDMSVKFKINSDEQFYVGYAWKNQKLLFDEFEVTKE